MARPHIEFIQSQALPWREDIWNGRFDGAAVKVLSEDGETGAASTLVRYPAGWSRSGAEHLNADEELLVLDGAMEINAVGYTELCYAHLPAGHTRPHDQTWMLSAPPLWRNDVIEIHPVVEEMYLVTGDLAGDTGLMKAGASFWRPASMPHGPFGSKTGNLLFFRTKGGPLSTHFRPSAHLFSWETKLRPVLPPELAEYAPKVESEASYY